MTAQLASILFLSLKVSFLAMVFAVPLALGLAYILARKRFFGHGLLSALSMMPLVMPPVVTGYVLLIALGPQAPLGQFFDSVFGVRFAFETAGAALASGLVAFPLIVRPIRLSIEAIDPKLYEVVEAAGLSRWRQFLVLTLPQAVPGILAGAVLGFAKALGEFGATITFVSNIPGKTQTLSLAIFSAFQSPNAQTLIWQLCLISLAVSLVAVLGSEWLAAFFAKRLAGRRRNHA